MSICDMDNGKKNIILSGFFASVVCCATLLVLQVTYIPMEQEWRDQVIKEKCPQGIENCGLLLEPSPLVYLFCAPTILTFFISVHYLEKKKNKEAKSWRSYN